MYLGKGLLIPYWNPNACQWSCVGCFLSILVLTHLNVSFCVFSQTGSFLHFSYRYLAAPVRNLRALFDVSTFLTTFILFISKSYQFHEQSAPGFHILPSLLSLTCPSLHVLWSKWLPVRLFTSHPFPNPFPMDWVDQLQL